MHLPGRNLDLRFSFSPERSSKERSALEQLFGDEKFGDGSLAQPDIELVDSRPWLGGVDRHQKGQYQL